MKNTSKKHLFPKVLLGILIFIAICFVALRLYFRLPVHNYYKNSQKAFRIPYTHRGFIAQGISFDSDENLFYVTGYMKNGSASPIFVINKDSKKLENTVFMQTPDGQDFHGHCGGISVYKDKVYVAGGSDQCLYVFNKGDIKKGGDRTHVVYESVISLKRQDDGVGVAFTTVHNDILYAGEFYRLPNYPTSSTHTITSSNTENHALMVALDLKNNAEPVAVYSIPGKVQGLCFAEGKIYASTSYAVANSNIYVYDESKLTHKGSLHLLDKDLPLYVLDDTCLCNTITIAPMSEEIEFVDNQFYVMCESASNKYVFGKFTGGAWCYKSQF